jgi:spore maturation protein CgeB
MNRTLIIVGTERPEALESSYARAFSRQGWRVQVWDPVRALHRVVRGGSVGRLFATFVHVEPWQRKANLELLQLADSLKPDLVLVIGTRGVRAGTLAQLRVRQPNVLLYCIYPDSPHSLDDERVRCLPWFDRFTTSSPAWTSVFGQLGARRVHYLPFAADTDLHRPVRSTWPKPNYAHDVTFIGTWRLEREQLLEQLVGLDLGIWGNAYWKRRTRKNSPLKRHWGGREVFGDEFAQVCAQSKIMLNVLDPISWPGPNMRTFELPACRAFALTERTAPVLELFCEGETIECFDSAGEALEKIHYYAGSERARQRIADAALRQVLEGGHTYRDRVQKVCGWMAKDVHRWGNDTGS